MGALSTTLMWINRKWFLMLTNGTAVLDWGDGMAQELASGEFICYEPEEYGHVLSDDELTALIQTGRVASFSAQKAGLYAWPSR